MNDYCFDDNTAYICISYSLSSPTTTLSMDEGDDDEHKGIYCSSWDTKMNKLLDKWIKSSVSLQRYEFDIFVSSIPSVSTI